MNMTPNSPRGTLSAGKATCKYICWRVSLCHLSSGVLVPDAYVYGNNPDGAFEHRPQQMLPPYERIFSYPDLHATLAQGQSSNKQHIFFQNDSCATGNGNLDNIFWGKTQKMHATPLLSFSPAHTSSTVVPDDYRACVTCYTNQKQCLFHMNVLKAYWILPCSRHGPSLCIPNRHWQTCWAT